MDLPRLTKERTTLPITLITEPKVRTTVEARVLTVRIIAPNVPTIAEASEVTDRTMEAVTVKTVPASVVKALITLPTTLTMEENARITALAVLSAAIGRATMARTTPATLRPTLAMLAIMLAKALPTLAIARTTLPNALPKLARLLMIVPMDLPTAAI